PAFPTRRSSDSGGVARGGPDLFPPPATDRVATSTGNDGVLPPFLPAPAPVRESSYAVSFWPGRPSLAESQEMADLAKKKLRKKIPELELALEGKVEEHHRFLLKLQLDRLQAVEKDLALLEQRLQNRKSVE